MILSSSLSNNLNKTMMNAFFFTGHLTDFVEEFVKLVNLAQIYKQRLKIKISDLMLKSNKKTLMIDECIFLYSWFNWFCYSICEIHQLGRQCKQHTNIRMSDCVSKSVIVMGFSWWPFFYWRFIHTENSFANLVNLN